jgi:AcrR family transcriptional regulator
MTRRERVPRTKDPEITAALLDAAIALVELRGYANVSLEAVAARAGVGKPAIYRRFADKTELVIAAIEHALPEMELPPENPAETLQHLRTLLDRAVPSDPEAYAALIGGLMAEYRVHPELIAAFRDRILLPRRAVLRAAIERAQAHGLLRDDMDAELAVDFVGGAFLARAYAGLDMTPAWRDGLFAAWWGMFEERAR